MWGVPKNEDSRPVHFIGMISSLSHNLSQGGGQTSMTVSYARSHKDGDTTDDLFSDKLRPGGKFLLQTDAFTPEHSEKTEYIVQLEGEHATAIFGEIGLVAAILDFVEEVMKSGSFAGAEAVAEKWKTLDSGKYRGTNGGVIIGFDASLNPAVRGDGTSGWLYNRERAFLAPYLPAAPTPPDWTVVRVPGSPAPITLGPPGDPGPEVATLEPGAFRNPTDGTVPSQISFPITPFSKGSEQDIYDTVTKLPPGVNVRSDWWISQVVITEQVGETTKRANNMPIEECIRPPWVSDEYRNWAEGGGEHIGPLYQKLFGCSSIIQQIPQENGVPKLREGDEFPSIEYAVDAIVGRYSAISGGGYLAESHVQAVTRRGFATLPEVVGPKDLDDATGESGGFHSAAFGRLDPDPYGSELRYLDLVGVDLTSQVDGDTKKAKMTEDIGEDLDPRTERLTRVKEYLRALLIGMRG